MGGGFEPDYLQLVTDYRQLVTDYRLPVTDYRNNVICGSPSIQGSIH